MDEADSDLDCSAGAVRQANQAGEVEDGLESTKPEPGPRRTLSKAERERRHKARLANQFPNGPEARELASMDKPMPTTLREKIVRGGKYELWSEAFRWLAFDLHRKARNGTKFYPKLVVKKLWAAYPDLDPHADEVSWLEGWIGYLGQFRTELRSGGTYGPGVDLLEALGAERDLFEHIDSFDIEPDGGEDREVSASEPARRSTGDLPPVPRELPFRFTELSSSTAKTFWRAYWNSNDIEAIREAGRMLASDPWARGEMERLGEEAENFFVQTMAKLAIPLS